MRSLVADSDNNTATMTRMRSSVTASADPAPSTAPCIDVAEPAASPPAAGTSAEGNQTLEPGTSTAVEEQDPVLDQEILALLGEAPKVETNFGKATHKDLASRWQDILQKGLPKEGKDKLLQEYLIPENCDLLVAPELNPEVKAALADPMIRRDFSLMAKQKQLSVAIAAINQAIELLISKESHAQIIKSVSDACRLLCDIHYDSTNTRRGFVLSSINADMKEAISEAKRDKYLFGENFSEKLKAAKSIKKSGTDLKQKFNKNNFVKQHAQSTPKQPRLNWKTLPRKPAYKPEAGKPRQGQGRAAAGSSGFQQRGRSSDHTATKAYRRR